MFKSTEAIDRPGPNVAFAVLVETPYRIPVTSFGTIKSYKPIVLEPRETGIRTSPKNTAVIQCQRPYENMRQAVKRTQLAYLAIRGAPYYTPGSAQPDIVIAVRDHGGDQITVHGSGVNHRDKFPIHPAGQPAKSGYPKYMVPVLADREHSER